MSWFIYRCFLVAKESQKSQPALKSLQGWKNADGFMLRFRKQ